MGPRPNPCPIRTKCSASPKMKVVLLLPLIAAVITAPEARFTCEECVREMHGLAAMVKMGAIPIHDYLRDNYCPTLDSTAAQHFCEDSSPNTTLACCLRLSSTTSSMEDFTFARQRELAKPESTLVRNVFKAFSGLRRTWRTQLWLLSSG